MSKFAALCAAALSMLILGAAQAAPVTYHAYLTGAAEAPPNASPGTGEAWVVYDDAANTLHITATFGGLLGTTTASHIHCCTAVAGTGTGGVATTTPTFSGFPLGVTAGTYDITENILDASTWNPAFVTANGGTPASAAAVFLTRLAEGRTYFNIHTTAFPGGEIRGFLQVPEPATATLTALALALAMLGSASRLRRT